MTNLNETDIDIVQEVERLGELVSRARQNIGNVIFGQTQVVDFTLAALLGGGHALLVGVPGLAKTRLVETIARVLGMEETRIQFTPDLMPADILGSEVLAETPEGQRSFRFLKGPVFTQLLMADEINRASPRTQSALLQAMQERHVTIGGKRYDLPHPFHVLATQNPLEHEGTYPLPEAQLDRFLMEIDISYPDLAAERRMLFATTGDSQGQAEQVMTPEDLMAAQRLVRRMPVGDNVVNAILELVRRARPGEEGADPEITKHLGWGPGPRASQAFMLAARAKCLMEGRLAPSIDDINDLAQPVLKHRMALSFAARAEGLDIPALIRRLCASLG